MSEFWTLHVFWLAASADPAEWQTPPPVFWVEYGRMGDICFQRLIPVSILAAEFCTYFNLYRHTVGEAILKCTGLVQVCCHKCINYLFFLIEKKVYYPPWFGIQGKQLVGYNLPDSCLGTALSIFTINVTLGNKNIKYSVKFMLNSHAPHKWLCISKSII